MKIAIIAQCFLKEKLIKNKPFYAKNVNQNENYEETSHVYMHKENKE